jgi:hypothetical protein
MMAATNRSAAAGKRPLSKAVRAAKRKDLHQLVLAASLRANELVSDDLVRAAREEATPELRDLTLAAHRLQLVLRTVDGGAEL